MTTVRMGLRAVAAVLVLLLASLRPGAADPGTDSPPKRSALTLLYQGKLPSKINPARIESLVGTFLRGDAEEQAVAGEELVKTGPLVAYVARERLVRETDAGVRARLEDLMKKVTADTAVNAQVLFHYAQALATVSKGHGPLEWDDPGLPRWRAMAKLCHLLFVNPAFFGDIIDAKLGVFEPYRDLPAAADLYREAGAMWERLAGAHKDPAEAAKAEAESQRCKILADQALEEAAQVK